MSEKEYSPWTKCLCTNTWIRYIKAQGWNSEGIYEGIDYNEEYMCDVENWMPSAQVYKFCTNISKKYPREKELFSKMALWGAKNRTPGAFLYIAASFLNAGLVYGRLPKYIETFNKHRKVEIVELKKTGRL